MISRSLIFSLSFLGLFTSSMQAEERQPNLILIISDDLSWGDLGCYGQTMIKTPNIDRLAAEGIRFTNAYAGNSVCAPSRSCLMQGLHPGHATVRGNSYRTYRHCLQPDDVILPEYLKEAGYATGLFGKWGLALHNQTGKPNDKGFDQFFGYLNQRKAHNYYPPYLWENETRVDYPAQLGFDYKSQNPYDEEGQLQPIGITDLSAARYSFDEIHRHSLEFVEQHHDQPFFLYLAHTIPHGPLVVPELGEYQEEDWAIGYKEWAAMVTRLDSAVGELLDVLKKHELQEETFILFASDNGLSSQGYDRDKTIPPLAEHFEHQGPTRGRKGDIYDGAFRVPAIAHWPGTIEAGRVEDQIWAFWDVLPTFLELTGKQAPLETDGLSLVPTLSGSGEQPQHEYLYWEFNQHQAIRSEDWYAVRKHQTMGGRKIELYDLAADPEQKQDISNAHPLLIERMQQWMNESHTPSEVWPSPGENMEQFQQRLQKIGAPERPFNIND